MITAGTLFGALALAATAVRSAAQPSPQPPNVIVILADDIGYGDLSCYGATRIHTPNVDGLAKEGLRFTDGHAAASTCTPSRYALLTGQYAWRKPGTNILPGDAALIIDPSHGTLPLLFRQAGYTTGAVGKWHLGLGSEKGKQDWNGEVHPGPREVGFDYSFIIPATGDRTPCVFMEDGRVVGQDPNDPIRVSYGAKVGDDPTGREHPELLKMKPSQGHDQTIVNGISRIGYMSGGKKARWVDEKIADTITQKAVDFLERSREHPFFLYFATHDIHVPRVPNQRYVGKTGLGPRGDAVVEFDGSVGEIMATLRRLKLDRNTLVVVTSDNGPVVDDGYQDEAVTKLDGHHPAGPLRGGKYSNFEAGTRLPFLTWWPGHVRPGTSDALVCQVDFLASFAALLGKQLPADAGPDSFNVLPALLGDMPRGREQLIEQAGRLSLRQGSWKYVPPSPGPRIQAGTGVELGNDPRGQLYDLSTDLGEKHNLIEERPEVAKSLTAAHDRLVQSQRTAPPAR
jgi:arylsulfatase A-like enzyme